MKKVLAILIPAILSAGAVNAAEIYNKDGNKLDLYGKVDARHLVSKDDGNDGDATYVRLGFKGETQITDSLSGYGQWEYNIQVNNAEEDGTAGSATRLGFAGLKFGDFGSFDYGRNYGVIYDVEAMTDILPVFGGDSYSASDNFMTGRANNIATYRNSNFFGWLTVWISLCSIRAATVARAKAPMAAITLWRMYSPKCRSWTRSSLRLNTLSWVLLTTSTKTWPFMQITNSTC